MSVFPDIKMVIPTSQGNQVLTSGFNYQVLVLCCITLLG